MAFDPEAVRAFERDGFSRAAAAYETAFAPATRPFIPRLLDAAGVGPGMEVLDLCCGPGFVGAAAGDRGARATGMDFSDAMLAEGRARFATIDFVHGDAEAPPFGDERFDAVVSNFGVHHVPRPALAMAGAMRVLRPGGRFAFTIWAGPEENIAFGLVAEAVRRFGDMSASTAPPPGGGLATGADCLMLLHAAGFEATEAHLLRAVWRHLDATSVIQAMMTGTARNAAMLLSQTSESLPAIVAGLEEAASPYRDADGLALPLACIVAAGTRPPRSRP